MFQVKSILSLFGVVFHAITMEATPDTDLHLGHFETQIDYEVIPGDPDSGWSFAVSYDVTNDFNTAEGINRLDPAKTTILATPDTKTSLGSDARSTDLIAQGLGQTNDTIWILPQSNRPGQIFFGWRNVIEPGIFQLSVNGSFVQNPAGSIVVDLIDVSGTAVDAGGHFAMWESKSLGGVEMHFNTADGLNANDRLTTVPVGQHTHYAYGMTQPGNYEVTFRASGRLNPWQPDGNQDTSGTGTFHFSVPFSSVVTGEAELRLSLDEVNPASVHKPGETVEYSATQVALITEPVEITGIPHDYAFLITPETSSDAVEPHRVGIQGSNPVAFPSNIAPGIHSSFAVLETLGPGSAQVITDPSRDSYFLFSQPGIYRVHVRAIGDQNGSTVFGPTFELTFLAGLEADYDFAAYADSFERTHGLLSGSLKNDGSDWDGDGIPDIIEYQLFWEGLDPAVADGHKLPTPDPTDPDGLIVFHRDTYKDRLNRTTQNIVLEHSGDLSNWTGWSDRSLSFPLEQYETGAEHGNAYGRIQRRKIRLPEGIPEAAYFRWRIDPSD